MLTFIYDDSEIIYAIRRHCKIYYLPSQKRMIMQKQYECSITDDNTSEFHYLGICIYLPMHTHTHTSESIDMIHLSEDLRRASSSCWIHTWPLSGNRFFARVKSYMISLFLRILQTKNVLLIYLNSS